MSKTDDQPRLSFLTPAYRTEAYLADTIASVLAQTSTAWELVVVDNGNSCLLYTSPSPRDRS